MVLRRRTEVPHDRLGRVALAPGKQRETADLVLRPCADRRRGQVADVVHVEDEQRAHFGLTKLLFRLSQTLLAQTIEVDTLLPIHSHRSVSLQRHFVGLPSYFVSPDI